MPGNLRCVRGFGLKGWACAIGLGCIAFLHASFAVEWSKTVWHGERAWKAASGQWLAIVSEERARLVFFGGAAGDHNLLFAPPGPGAFAGGHIFWLGPQSTWPVDWPPVSDWDSPADNVRVDGDTLIVELPNNAPEWQAVTRTYRWEDETLILGSSWSPGVPGRQAIHIVQLPRSAIVEVAAGSTTRTARPFAIFDNAGLQPGDFETPVSNECVRVSENGSVSVRADGRAMKLGFLPQPIFARVGGAILALERGAQTGAGIASNFDGRLTQIYLGGDRNPAPFLEIEQLSPVLEAMDGRAGFEARLSATWLGEGEEIPVGLAEWDWDSLDMVISPDHPAVQLSDGFEVSADGARTMQPGAEASITFEGSSANATLVGAGNHVEISINGKPTQIVKLGPEPRIIRLARNLDPSMVNRVSITRMTGHSNEELVFHGFQLNADAVPTPLATID